MRLPRFRRPPELPFNSARFSSRPVDTQITRRHFDNEQINKENKMEKTRWCMYTQSSTVYCFLRDRYLTSHGHGYRTTSRQLTRNHTTRSNFILCDRFSFRDNNNYLPILCGADVDFVLGLCDVIESAHGR